MGFTLLPTWSPLQFPGSQPARGLQRCGSCENQVDHGSTRCPSHVPLLKERGLRLSFPVGGIQGVCRHVLKALHGSQAPWKARFESGALRSWESLPLHTCFRNKSEGGESRWLSADGWRVLLVGPCPHFSGVIHFLGKVDSSN